MNVRIRLIRQEDNPHIAGLIRQVLEEFGAARPGTVYTDPTTDRLFELFREPRSCYFVAETEPGPGHLSGTIVGGCGIYPTDGLPDGCTELVKLYLSAEARGKGIGKMLMERSLEAARQAGYQEVYLETLPELHIAVGLYERVGFEYLEQPYGNSGHYACDLWMVRKL